MSFSKTRGQLGGVGKQSKRVFARIFFSRVSRFPSWLICDLYVQCMSSMHCDFFVNKAHCAVGIGPLLQKILGYVDLMSIFAVSLSLRFHDAFTYSLRNLFKLSLQAG